MTSPEPPKRRGRPPGAKSKPKPQTQVVHRTGKTARHPWEQIRDHFITAETALTLKEIAEVYGISYNVVRSRAGDERWTYLRAEYQTNVAIAMRDARSKSLVKEAMGFDDTSLKAAKVGQTLILGRLGQIAQLFQASNVNFEKVLAKVRQGLPLDPHEMRSTINYKELVELANALDRFQMVGRKALGIDSQQIDINAVISGTSTVTAEVNIHAELSKPDLDRTTAVFEAMRRAGLKNLFDDQLALTAGTDGDEDNDETDGSDEEDGEGSDDDSDGSDSGSARTVLVGEIVAAD